MAGKKERELAENVKALQQNIELVEDDVKQTVLEHKLAKKDTSMEVDLV
jgi:outer membrane murein-binding lipoprotein Lpp